ncbi:hypothetical protein OQA88_8121 [Cercophora sp. LCS_1]
MKHPLLSLFVSLALASHILIPKADADADDPPRPPGTIKCPIWRPGYRESWETTERTYRVNASLCFENTTRTFSAPQIYTSATLYQTEEKWQNDTRKPDVLSAIKQAIIKSLELFGAHAGNTTSPLQIHLTLSSSGRTISRSRNWNSLVVFDGWKPRGSHCYINIAYPLPSYENEIPVPLLKLKKDLVRKMYHCVQQYHHPDISWDSLDEYNDYQWWVGSIAVFFDGLAYPTTAEIFPSDPDYRERYPEGFVTLGALPDGLTGPYAALFWHSVQNAGWTPRQISEWMRNRTLREGGRSWETGNMNEQEAMASDQQMCELFHRFGRVLARKNVRYPDGQVIRLSDNLPWGLNWVDSKWGVLNPVALKVGEEVDLLDRFWYLESWTVQRIDVPLDQGQVLDVLVRWRDGPARDGTRVYEGPLPKAEELEVSYRLSGMVDLVRVEKGETVRIVLPPRAGSGSRRSDYEFFVTSTGGYQRASLEMIVKRVE